MKSSEVRERSNEELKTLLDQMNKDLFKKKMDHSLDQLKDVHTLRQLRRDIAKVKTIIREREIAG